MNDLKISEAAERAVFKVHSHFLMSFKQRAVQRIIEAELDRIAGPLVEALVALDAKLEAIHADPLYKSVWFCFQNHGGDYSNGPKYDIELSAVKQSLINYRKERGE